MVICIGTGLYFSVDGAQGTEFENGLGITNIQSLASLQPDDAGSSGIVPTSLIANLPQLGFSIVYLAYNNFFTRMLLAQELDRFASHAKGLRVSEVPRGSQRSTHLLSLPARWAVPLMAFSAVAHWLLSQSLFLVRIDGVDADGNIDDDDRLTRLGYSVTAIISALAVLILGTVIAVMLGFFKKLQSGHWGDGSSNSVVISAACHPVIGFPQPPDISIGKVKWGDITPETGEAETGQGIRHCGFTSGTAAEPREGSLYRG